MIFQYKHTSFDDSVMVWLKSCRKYKVFFPITKKLRKKKTIFPNIILKTSILCSKNVLFFAKIIKNQKKIASIFFYIQNMYYLCTALLDNRLLIHLKEYSIMKKKYTQPDILCEKLSSCDIITQSIGDDYATDDPNNPVLAPKRQGIWDEED